MISEINPVTNKSEAIEFLRNKILDEIKTHKSIKILLASLLWEDAAKCFPNPISRRWDSAHFYLDLNTRKISAELSTYPVHGAYHEDKISISTEEFNQIVNKYNLEEELKFIQADEDLNMIFDENLNKIIFNTQKIIQQEREKIFKFRITV